MLYVILFSPFQEMDEDPVLFPASLQDGHAKQGLLGDCWFLCACTFLLKNKHLMNKVEPCAGHVSVSVCAWLLATICSARQVCLYSTVQTQGRSRLFTNLANIKTLKGKKLQINNKKEKCVSKDVYTSPYHPFPLYSMSQVLSLK